MLALAFGALHMTQRVWGTFKHLPYVIIPIYSGATNIPLTKNKWLWREHRPFDAIPIRKSKCSNVGAFAQLAGRSVVGHWPLERPLSQAAAKLGVPCTNKRTSTATSKFWAGVPHHMIKLSQAIKQKECPPGGSVCHEQTFPPSTN